MVYKAGELTLEANTGQKVKCTKVKDSFESGVLLGSSAGEPGMSSQIFELSACKVEGDGTKCTKVSEPVVTKLLKAELVENESKENLLVEFKPASGAQLATLKFTAETGGSCVAKETQVTGSVSAEALTSEEKVIKLPEEIKGETWLFRFPATPIKKVWLVKAGVGSSVAVGLTAFGEEAKETGTALISLAEVTEGQLIGAGEDYFDAEKGWKAEAKGGGSFQITEKAKVACEKETFEGVSPTKGLASTSDMAPKYSGCKFELEVEGKTTTTKAEVNARGCNMEYLNPEEPGKDKFKAELDISKCSGGEKGGILITDKELEAGKTCEVNIPDQALGREDEDSDTKEAEPFEFEAKIDAKDTKAETNECPEEIEKGKTPGIFEFVFEIPGLLFIGAKFRSGR